MKELRNELDGYEKGGWIRFYKDGLLVIGQIEYFWIETGGFRYAATEVGGISLDSILEYRKYKETTS